MTAPMIQTNANELDAQAQDVAARAVARGHARELSQQRLVLPDVVQAPYLGAREVSSAMGRGAFWGLVGFGLGRVIGFLGAPDKLDQVPPRTVGGALALVGAVMGAYTAMRESRDAQRQHDKMSRSIFQMADHIQELKGELREQLKAREGLEHDAQLEGYRHQWEKDHPTAPKPATQVQAPSVAAMEALAAAPAEHLDVVR